MDYKDIFDVGNVLVVEDDVLTAETLIDKLGVLGCNDTMLATDLKQADRIIETEKIDLALLHVKLAKGERTIQLGHSLAAKGIRVVFMSGYNRIDMMRATQGFEFIEKPISLSRLKATLQPAVIRVPLTVRQPSHI